MRWGRISSFEYYRNSIGRFCCRNRPRPMPAELELCDTSKSYTRTMRFSAARLSEMEQRDEVRMVWPPPRLSSIYLNQRRAGKMRSGARARIMRVTHNKAGTQTQLGVGVRDTMHACHRVYIRLRACAWCIPDEEKGKPTLVARTTGARCSSTKSTLHL